MGKVETEVTKYYENAPVTHKPILLEMRKRILEVIPNADEIMKYGMPTFVVNGVPIAGLLANKKHIGYYPYSGSVLSKLPYISAKYVTTKGALHVPIDKPLLKSEVRMLIKTRLNI